MLLLRSILAAASLLFTFSARAHFCGPPSITVPLGGTVIWNIDANLEEVQTLYTPVDLGDSDIAVITPNRQFLAHDAYFAILGKRDGTTQFTYSWFYAGTGVGGLCTVTVNVRAGANVTGISSPLGLTGAPLFIFAEYIYAQRYIFTPQTMPPGAQYNPQTGQFYWIPNAYGFFILQGLWALAANPEITTPVILHFLINHQNAFRLSARWDAPKFEMCVENPLFGPVTIERSLNLRDWHPVATYDKTPEREIRYTPTPGLETAAYRMRLGAPTLQLNAASDLSYFRYPNPEGFAANSRLYWAIRALGEAPAAFEGPLSPFNGDFILPLDAQNLPERGNIFFAVQDAERTTPVMSQAFEKIKTTPINTPPTLTGLPDIITIPQNGQPSSFRFTLTDDRTSPTQLEIHPESSNPVVVPDFRISPTVDYVGRGTLTVSANPNQIGSAQIQLNIFDGQTVATKTITAQTAANTAPRISRIQDLYTLAGAPTRQAEFTVGDAETPVGSLGVSAVSGFANLVAQDGIAISGSGADRRIVVTPKPGVTGSASITVTVADQGGLTAQSTFDVVVPASSGPALDLNLDGKNDLVLQDNTGALLGWNMNGPERLSEAPFDPPTTGNPDWRVISGRIFGRDRRRLSILFEHADRTLALWNFNGRALDYGAFTHPAKSPEDSRAVAFADLDRDGHNDIIFQTDAAIVSAWLMGGANQKRALTFGVQPAEKTARLVGAADFNADGYPDFVFQDSLGFMELWHMNMNTRLSQTPFKPDRNTRRAVAVADLNNDGQPDLLFQDPTGGPIDYWQMSGANRVAEQTLTPNPPGSFHLAAP